MLETPLVQVPASSHPDALHVKTLWRLRSNGELLWTYESELDELLELRIPPYILRTGKTYTLEANYEYDNRDISRTVQRNFSTRDSFFIYELNNPLHVGQPLGGGYFTGGAIEVDGKAYALVVAAVQQGGLSPERLQWKTFFGFTLNTDSPITVNIISQV